MILTGGLRVYFMPMLPEGGLIKEKLFCGDVCAERIFF